MRGMHTSTNPIPFSYPIDENYYNQPISPPSEVVEHSIDNYEIRREFYPYEKFKVEELPILGNASKKIYNDMLRLANGIEPLAYYFYENKQLTVSSMKAFIPVYKEYMSTVDHFDIKTLKSYFVEQDATNSQTKATLKRKWKQWFRLCKLSYGIKKDDFPSITFSNKKKGREQYHGALSKETIEYACRKLYDRGLNSDALMLHLMFACSLRPGEVKFLTFENVKAENKNWSIQIYRSKRDSFQTIAIPQSLYNEIIDHKHSLEAVDKYKEETRCTTRDDNITGHFLFDVNRSNLERKFTSGFGGVIDDVKIRPKDLRISSISHKNTHGTLAEAAALADHKNTRVTSNHYTRAALEFDASRQTNKSGRGRSHK